MGSFPASFQLRSGSSSAASRVASGRIARGGRATGAPGTLDAMPDGTTRALVLGSITRDRLATPEGGERERPGGVVLYAGRALARLGARVRVVTRVRRSDAGELLAPLRADGVETLALPSRRTTTYRLDYRGSSDRHELLASSDPIGPDDVPAAWRNADLVQLGPLHRTDLLPETAAAVTGLVGLDAQGLAREQPPALRTLDAFLQCVDVLQVSEADLAALTGGDRPERFAHGRGLRELVVTRGARGALVITPRGVTEVPAEPAGDGCAVGAGDVFLAVYLLDRVRGADPVDSARVAARACALHVRHGELPADLSLEVLL